MIGKLIKIWGVLLFIIIIIVVVDIIIIMATCFLRPKKGYILQVINLTGNLRPVLVTQVSYIIIIETIY